MVCQSLGSFRVLLFWASSSAVGWRWVAAKNNWCGGSTIIPISTQTNSGAEGERARHGTGQTLVQRDDCSTRRWCWWLVSAFWRVCSSGSAVCCNGRRHEENRGWKDIAEQTMISCSIVESPNNSPKDNNELNDFMWLSFMRFGIK